MSRVLEEFPQGSRVGRPVGTRASRFDPFMDGRIWEIPLSDFPDVAGIEQLRRSITSLARSRMLRSRSTVCSKKELLIFQVIGVREV